MPPCAWEESLTLGAIVPRTAVAQEQMDSSGCRKWSCIYKNPGWKKEGKVCKLTESNRAEIWASHILGQRGEVLEEETVASRWKTRQVLCKDTVLGTGVILESRL